MTKVEHKATKKLEKLTKRIKIADELRNKIELINSKHMPDVIKEVRRIIEEMIPKIVIDENYDRFFDGKTMSEIKGESNDFFLGTFIENFGLKVIVYDLHYSENELEEIKNILDALDNRETVICLQFIDRFTDRCGEYGESHEVFYSVYIAVKDTKNGKFKQ